LDLKDLSELIIEFKDINILEKPKVMFLGNLIGVGTLCKNFANLLVCVVRPHLNLTSVRKKTHKGSPIRLFIE